ncbi:MAG TPA: hypothetical protein PLZ36_15855 [Armatimonadota bacterium]|nr:hypothetical protein [Armatimonadota bacterium]
MVEAILGIIVLAYIIWAVIEVIKLHQSWMERFDQGLWTWLDNREYAMHPGWFRFWSGIRKGVNYSFGTFLAVWLMVFIIIFGVIYAYVRRNTRLF